ncbi:electron transfer flavoprotein subunit beta/FixA family protein [Dehalococcoidia bacterium]|nr:electron transfer flavoprotein subunit beta/FixA family protein [Dehalococcoidia bacterium]
MPIDIIVCAKQVIDPEMPSSSFNIDPASKRVIPVPGIPPVVNGFDENAVEAALLINDAIGANITVLSVGCNFTMDVMKKPLSMGAENLILVDDPMLADLDSFATANVLDQAIRKIGHFDLILCGRQASDWDNAMVPLGLSESLSIPCITLARNIEVADRGLIVHRSLTDGYEVVEAPLPAVVTVTNELGEPRYPTLRGIMTASRKAPTVWSASDLGLTEEQLYPKIELTDLYIPVSDTECEFIEGDDEADAGRLLAMRLREARLI